MTFYKLFGFVTPPTEQVYWSWMRDLRVMPLVSVVYWIIQCYLTSQNVILFNVIHISFILWLCLMRGARGCLNKFVCSFDQLHDQTVCLYLRWVEFLVKLWTVNVLSYGHSRDSLLVAYSLGLFCSLKVYWQSKPCLICIVLC